METDFKKAPMFKYTGEKSAAECIGDTVLAIWNTMRESKNNIPYGDFVFYAEGKESEKITVRVYNKAKD